MKQTCSSERTVKRSNGSEDGFWHSFENDASKLAVFDWGARLSFDILLFFQISWLQTIIIRPSLLEEGSKKLRHPCVPCAFGPDRAPTNVLFAIWIKQIRLLIDWATIWKTLVIIYSLLWTSFPKPCLRSPFRSYQLAHPLVVRFLCIYHLHSGTVLHIIQRISVSKR